MRVYSVTTEISPHASTSEAKGSGGGGGGLDAVFVVVSDGGVDGGVGGFVDEEVVMLSGPQRSLNRPISRTIADACTALFVRRP